MSFGTIPLSPDDKPDGFVLLSMYEKLQAENAELRELVRMMWKPFCWAQSGYDVCLTDEQDSAIRDMVRELGVDVD